VQLSQETPRDVIIQRTLFCFLAQEEKKLVLHSISLHCTNNTVRFVSVAHWHSARWAWNGYQPGLGSIPRPGRI